MFKDVRYWCLTVGLLGCAKAPEAPSCPAGTERAGVQCLPKVDLAPTDPRTLISPGDAGPGPDAGPRPDAGEPRDGGGGVNLPFFIEEHYAMTGFFSETQAATVDRQDCSGVSGTKAGATCMRITFVPNGDAYGGFFFQNPENNWGQMPGLNIPPGAQQVRLRAWGAAGGESLKFGAGINNQEPFDDGFNVETNAIALTTTPTDYFVDLRGVSYSTVAGGFSWVVETPSGTGNVTFFLDNIEWTTEAPKDTAVALPFWVDDHYAMSGFFPGPPGVMEVTEGCPGFTGTDPGSVCRRIRYLPNGQTFGGFYFQNPPDNFGQLPGLSIAPGATRITFRAWGETGAERAAFGAGLDNSEPNDDGWHVEGTPAPLPTTPTPFLVDISAITYDRVAGGFLWVVATPDGSTPVTIYLDNVRWE